MVFSFLALACGALAAAFGAELLLRIWPPPSLRIRLLELEHEQTDEAWSVEKVEGRFKQFTPHTEVRVRGLDFDYSAHFDAFGGRQTPSSQTAPLVPVLGDSFAFGVGVDDDETMVSRLAAAVPARLLNLGVPGMGLSEAIDILELRHEELGEPELYLICSFLGNDFSDAYDRAYREGGAKGPRLRSLPLEWPPWMENHVFQNALLKHSYLVQFSRFTILHVLDRFRGSLVPPAILAMDETSVYFETAVAFLDRELVRLQTLARSEGFEVRWVLIPDRLQVVPERCAAEAESVGWEFAELNPRAPNEALQRLLENHGFDYWDMTDALAAEADPDAFYFPMDMHFSEKGNTWAADYLLQQGIANWIAEKALKGADRTEQ